MIRMKEQSSHLQFEISAIPDATYTSENLPLRIAFRNRGPTVAYILDHFDPLPVFFSFRVVKPDGTPVSLPGAGKIDFGPQAPGLIELGPGKAWSTPVNLTPLIVEELPPGSYTISATYHNQYGDRCFKGRLSSNTIQVNLV
jgi:hypothetical protein